MKITSALQRALRPLPALLVLGSAALIAACGGGGSDASASANGSARIFITDAPACGYDQVNVTVEKIRVNQSATASATDGGWSELLLSPARRIDLLALSNGVLQELGTLPLPTGSYTQVRLVLAANTSSTPLANSVVPTGGAERALTTPSGQQSGVKINTNFNVEPTRVADLVLDFDACKSVVTAGNSGQILLKPVITAIPVFAAAGNAIEGFVNPAPGGVVVAAQQGGVTVRSTAPDASTGRFVIAPVLVGNYDLIITGNGRATAVITGVPVIDTARTVIASSGAPLALAASSTRSASGAASTTGSSAIPEATVRAIQRLGGGPNIELIARQVDAVTGGYSFTLPTAAPGRAAYAAGATYSFAADAPVAARYTIEAAVPGKTTQTADIDLTSADAVANFAFPI